jgi:hypothetical protein
VFLVQIEVNNLPAPVCKIIEFIITNLDQNWSTGGIVRQWNWGSFYIFFLFLLLSKLSVTV